MVMMAASSLGNAANCPGNEQIGILFLEVPGFGNAGVV
jgi:hypothetical protein